MQQAWATGTATLQGEHYQVDGAIVRPLPLQNVPTPSPHGAGAPGGASGRVGPGIPLWIAGGGEKVTLRIAAKYAQYTNFAGDPEGFAAKSAILRGHTDALGRDFAEITRSANYNTVIGATEAEVAERLDAIEARVAPYLGEATAGYMRDYRNGTALVGTPEQILERLTAMRELGLEYAIHYFPEHAYDRSGIELFEREVICELS